MNAVGCEGVAHENLSMSIKGVKVTDTWLSMILDDLPDEGFSGDAVLKEMTLSPLPGLELPEAVRPVLQHLKRHGMVYYDASNKRWHKSYTSQGALEDQKLSVLKENIPASENPTFGQGQPLSRYFDCGRFVAQIVCFCLVAALMAINAGFAWNLTTDPIFQIAFTVGFLGIDGLRPMLVARGLGLWGRMSFLARALALLIALVLAPASVVSSTSVISSALILGSASLEASEAQAEQLVSLRTELARLEARAVQAWTRHQQEFENGGCGDIAARLSVDAQEIERRIEMMRSRLAQSTLVNTTSTFAERTVQTLQLFGLNQPTMSWVCHYSWL